eukprot:Nk52_evm69s221 gene=Nk52_evmTU69s221
MSLSVEEQERVVGEGVTSSLSVAECGSVTNGNTSPSLLSGEAVTKYLSLSWKSDCLGAAYYDKETCNIKLMPDANESPPYFQTLRTLLLEVEPNVVILNKTVDQRVVKAVQSVFGVDCEADGPNSAGKLIVISPSNDFKFERCCSDVLHLETVCTRGKSREEIAFFNSGVINSEKIEMIRASGALVKYLSRNLVDILSENSPERSSFPLNKFELLTFSQFVYIDGDTFQALQVFNNEIHPSLNKKGNVRKEGLSLFGILSNSVSSGGKKVLKGWLKRPEADFEVIRKRQKDVAFFHACENEDVTRNIHGMLKSVRALGPILARVYTNGRISFLDWKVLHETCNKIHGIRAITKRIHTQNENISIVGKLLSLPEDVLQDLIMQLDIIDFEAFETGGKFAVVAGVDEELDEVSAKYSRLPEILDHFANQEVDSNPFIEKCQLEYFPQIGYLVGIDKTCLGAVSDPKEFPGLEFQFISDSVVHYRSAITKNLDLELGDLFGQIVDMETNCMILLQNSILDQSDILEAFSNTCLELDCIIGLALAARAMDFTCMPKLSDETSSIEIFHSRHPLQELSVGSFIPNDISFVRKEKEVNIVTGPNGSGKSIYLKQVPLLLIMAHIGSFIPAKSATIGGPIDKIFTRIQTRESVSKRESAFVIDLNQVIEASDNCTRNSLVVLDEFGKGTDSNCGTAILLAVIQYMLELKSECPYMVSTGKVTGFSQPEK